MKTYKKFVFFLFIFLLCALLFHSVVYTLYTEKVNPTGEKLVGDLARSSYYLGIIYPRKNENTLPKQHIKFNLYKRQKVDFLTIGDSFSNGGGYGRNRYYQDYFASTFEMDILNILQIPKTKNYIESIALLANTGYLKEMGVKYVLIETIQRLALERLAVSTINFDINTTDDLYEKIILTKDIYNPPEELKNKIGMVNNLNINAVLYNAQFSFKGYGKQGSYYIEKLNRELFSSPKSSEIIFYHDDIRKISAENEKNIKLINDNLNTLASILKTQGITLYFMPVVDKYNLYRENIVSNKYKASIFFEYFRTLPKQYKFVDTKAILLKELDKGSKDIFYSDDTHWSYKASEAIANSFIELKK
ncbi:MAG: hypothetical protein WC141_06750 [Arcobacteraceae bacterium]